MLPQILKCTDPLNKGCEAVDGEQELWSVREKAGVLVVDEDDLARVLLQLGLGLNGFEVWSAADGCEAVHLYRKHADCIAVVLLDFRMPGLDGLAMLDALRDLNPEVQVCFMGSDTAVYGLEALIRRGASHVIYKPIFLEDLVGILRPMILGQPVGPPPTSCACEECEETRGLQGQFAGVVNRVPAAPFSDQIAPPCVSLLACVGKRSITRVLLTISTSDSAHLSRLQEESTQCAFD